MAKTSQNETSDEDYKTGFVGEQSVNFRTMNDKERIKDLQGRILAFKAELDKEDLKKAFEQGERYDYRVTKAQCFNRWFNQNYIDAEKCLQCKYEAQKHYKHCINCVEHSKYAPLIFIS